MNVVNVVLKTNQHLDADDIEIYREFNGTVLRKDGQPLTEEDATALKIKYKPFDIYIGSD